MHDSSRYVQLRQDGFEPELMYAMVGQLVCSLDELSEGLTREMVA